MGFKDLIESLFKLSGSQAMPDTGSYVDFPVSSGATSGSFVAPYDGYINCTLSNSTAQAWWNIRSNHPTIEQAYVGVTLSMPEGAGSGMYFPIKKGQTFYFSAHGSTMETLRIFKIVGGGNKTAPRTAGGGVWHLSRFSNRFSSSAAGRQCRPGSRFKSASRSRAFTSPTQPRPMGILSLGLQGLKVSRQFNSKLQGFGCATTESLQLLIGEAQFRFERGSKRALFFATPVPVQASDSCSARPLVRPHLSLVTGGAA